MFRQGMSCIENSTWALTYGSLRTSLGVEKAGKLAFLFRQLNAQLFYSLCSLKLGFQPCFCKMEQDGNVPSRRHILGSKLFKEQLFEIFGKFFFSKKLFLNFFFEKVFFKSHNAEKLKKRPFRLIQRFLQTEMQGGTL